MSVGSLPFFLAAFPPSPTPDVCGQVFSGQVFFFLDLLSGFRLSSSPFADSLNCPRMFTRRCCNPHSLPFSREQRSCAGRSQLDDQPAQLAAACCSAAPLPSHSPRFSVLLPPPPRLFPSAAVLVTPSLLFFLVCFLSWIKSCCVGDTIACAEEGREDPLPTPGVAPPTLAMVFGVNTSPLGGKEGTYMTGRCARQALFVRFGGGCRRTGGRGWRN